MNRHWDVVASNTAASRFFGFLLGDAAGEVPAVTGMIALDPESTSELGDHRLDNLPSPKDLDLHVGSANVWDDDNPLRLQRGEYIESHVYRSPRVGLTLKKLVPDDHPETFILRDYRFLVEPRTIRKGTPNLVVALLRKNLGFDEIHNLTGCPVKTIQEYANQIREGEHLSLADFYGKAIGTMELCRLCGALLGSSR